MYLWLRWVFVAVCRPSPVAAGGGFSRCSAGLSFQWLLLLWGTGSRLPGFRVAAHGLSCSGHWDLPGPGIKPMSPALAGGFFTTEPPGTSLLVAILVLHLSNHCFVPDVDLFNQAYDFFWLLYMSEIRGPTPFFCAWLLSCPGTIYWRGCCLPTEVVWHHC